MSAQHTPGPWTANGRFVECAEGDICQGFSLENARLIAAAPVLLDAAREALEAYGPWSGKTAKQEDADACLRAAIAAALQSQAPPSPVEQKEG